jgi:hypothetical protein
MSESPHLQLRSSTAEARWGPGPWSRWARWWPTSRPVSSTAQWTRTGPRHRHTRPAPAPLPTRSTLRHAGQLTSTPHGAQPVRLRLEAMAPTRASEAGGATPDGTRRHCQRTPSGWAGIRLSRRCCSWRMPLDRRTRWSTAEAVARPHHGGGSAVASGGHRSDQPPGGGDRSSPLGHSSRPDVLTLDRP